LPVSNGYDTILTITDHDCSKAALFIPCNETIDSEGVAKLYTCHIVPHYGLPLKIILDCDPHFTSNFTTELCCLLGVKQNIGMAYHPQTDGQSEQTNQSLDVTTMGFQLLVMDSHYLRMITIQKHPRFRLKGTPMFTFDHIPVPISLQKGLKPIYGIRDTHG
jgi:hypothetical protein